MNGIEVSNTSSFYRMAVAASILSVVGMIIGLVLMDIDLSVKGFLAMTYIFSLSSCFTLAKVIRDKAEAERLINKVSTAKTEHMINKYVDKIED